MFFEILNCLINLSIDFWAKYYKLMQLRIVKKSIINANAPSTKTCEIITKEVFFNFWNTNDLKLSEENNR